MAEEGLWRHDHEGFTEIPGQLPAEQVEKVGRRCNIGYYHIEIGTCLQEAFHPGTGVLGTLAFISVWE